MKGWISSSKQQEDPLEPKNTQEEIRFEQMKRKVKISALEWVDLVLQEQLKSLMYVDLLLRGDPMKDKLINELNFKSCTSLRRNKKASSLLVVHTRKERLLFIKNIFMPTISSHIHFSESQT